MHIHKITLKILTLFFLIIPGIALAGVNSWTLDNVTNYSLSDPVTTQIIGGIGELKFQITHKSALTNGAGGALLNNPESIVVDGNYAYIASAVSDAIEIVDISDPANPIHVSSISNGDGGALLDDPRGIIKDGNYLYVTVNRSDALEIIDVSNPLSPIHVSSITRSATVRLNGARSIKKVGNYVYITSYSDDALEIIDVSNPNSPTHVGALRAAGGRLDGAQGIDVVGNYAYVTSDRDDSLQIIDISNPANPSFVGEIVNGTALLNAPKDIKVIGSYAYIVSSLSDSLTIIDISNPANPIYISSLADDAIMELNGARGIVIEGDYAYITAHDDDGLEIINISDPNNPTHVKSITDGGIMELNGAHSLQKVGNYIYISGRVDDGFEILEVGYTNTSPYIIPNSALVYSGSIDQITTIYGGGNQGNITYQISKDNGITWYYLNGTTRILTTQGTIQSNTPAEINYEIQSFNGLAGGTGEFKWKAFLNGDGTQKVELDKVIINSTSAGTNEIIDFETPGGYTVTGGIWTRQSITVQEGAFSIESGNHVDNTSSCFEMSKTIYNDSTISFFKSVDSEATYDFLRFYIDGVQQSEWSGNIGWSQEIYDIGNGLHNFRWCYEKDGSVSAGQDRAWVDYIEIKEKPVTLPPIVTDIINFETATGYTVTGGIWNRQSTTVQEGSFSIEADNQGNHNSSSCFETSRVLSADSTISFFKSVSSEENYDFLKFYIDGGLSGMWSGNIAWGQESYPIIAGPHTFKWCYEKDASVSNLLDTAWVDYIEIAQDPNPPVETPVLDFEIPGGYTVTTAVTTPGPDWQRITTDKYEGLWSIESQNQGIANSNSCFERVQTVSASDTGISFYKKVSSIAAWPDWDFLVFYIDGAEKNRWSGSSNWSREIYNLNPGTYNLRWCYQKNNTGNDPIDKAWVDLVSVTQDSPTLIEVTPVVTPTNDNTPSYTFNSPISGDTLYSGSCSSATDKATIGNNTIIFNSLLDGIYTNCTIQVLGTTSNSTILPISNFTIDTTRITNTINYPIDTTTIPNKSFNFDVSYSDDSGVDTGSIIFKLYKFDSGLGIYGSDIAGTYVDFIGATIGGAGAIYPVSQLGSGQFKIDFTISDSIGNASTTSTEFFINTSPLTLTTTINNSGGGVFNYEFTIENTSSFNITNWLIGFQLDLGTITTSNGGTFSNISNLFEVVSNSPTTTTFLPGQIHTINFSGTGNGIVTDLYLKSYTNTSPEIPIDYNLSQNGLDVAVTTTSITGNEYCRNIALTNNGAEDITNWQIQFDLDQTVYSISNGTFSQAGLTHTIDPLLNSNILIGNTENISFCTNGLKADNNWLISLVTLSLGDIIPPTISSTDPINSETKTSGTFDFIFNYSDNIGGDGINTASDEIYLYKWNGASYGPDISSTNMFLTLKTVTTTTATYPSNNITDGQYKVIFKIFDLNNNFVTTSVVFNLGIPPSDTTPPSITYTFPTNGILYPNANFNINISYSDSESPINTSSIVIDLQKWNGSIYGPDISATYITGNTITSSNAIYNVSTLGFGKYKIYFYIEDSIGNGNSSSIEFYIDEPELIISSGSLDIGSLNNGITKFSSGELNITVKTVGAGFDIILNKTSPLINGTIEIIDWNTVEGVGFDQSPYTSTINIINNNEIIATQGASINTSGNKNTYNYSIKLGALIGEQQTAGNYSGNISFGIDLNY